VKWAPALMLLAALAGPTSAAEFQDDPPYRMDDYRAPVPATVPGGTVLHIAEMLDLVRSGGGVLIDVLPAPRRPETMRPGMPWMPEPHKTLPGALWWPEVGRGALPPAMESHFRQRLEDVSDARRRLIVFFCLSNCWMSWNAAKRAASLGFRAGWFPEGVDGWEAAGLPVETAEPELLD
jgi:PQQ-dependent catabolism-associated CXXCW motif protein